MTITGPAIARLALLGLATSILQLTCEAAVSWRIDATSPSRARRAMAGPVIVMD